MTEAQQHRLLKALDELNTPEDYLTALEMMLSGIQGENLTAAPWSHIEGALLLARNLVAKWTPEP